MLFIEHKPITLRPYQQADIDEMVARMEEQMKNHKLEAVIIIDSMIPIIPIKKSNTDFNKLFDSMRRFNNEK